MEGKKHVMNWTTIQANVTPAMDCKTFASLEVEAYYIVYFVLYIAVDSYAEHDFPASERRSQNTMMYTLTMHTRGYEVVFHFPSAIRRLRIFHAW